MILSQNCYIANNKLLPVCLLNLSAAFNPIVHSIHVERLSSCLCTDFLSYQLLQLNFCRLYGNGMQQIYYMVHSYAHGPIVAGRPVGLSLTWDQWYKEFLSADHLMIGDWTRDLNQHIKPVAPTVLRIGMHASPPIYLTCTLWPTSLPLLRIRILWMLPFLRVANTF